VSEIEVYISLEGSTERIGTLFRQSSRGRESVSFSYHENWLDNPQRFSLEPGLTAGRGLFHPGSDREIFGSIGDSAPDTWGRRLMQRAE
jgi:serine/threonine-protein kinase HipA